MPFDSAQGGPFDSAQGRPDPELSVLFHQLNNQLGVILANAELLEHRLLDEGHKSRAGQVVTGALEAISTAKRIKQLTHPGGDAT